MALTVIYAGPQAKFFLARCVRVASAALSQGWTASVKCLSSPEAAPFARLGLNQLPLPVARAGLKAIKEVVILVRLTPMHLRHPPAVTHLIAAKAMPGI